MHDVVGQPERCAQCAHFVFEEVVERLNQVEMHPVGEGDEVVVALDGRGLAAGLARSALDNVGIDGALRQIRHRLPVAFELLGNGEEFLPKLRADDAALLFRLGHAVKQLRIALFGMHMDEINVELLGEHFLHLLGLALAQKAVVHKHAGHLLADGTRAESGHHRGIHAAGKRQNHAVASDFASEIGRHGLHQVVHGPVALKLADAE